MHGRSMGSRSQSRFQSVSHLSSKLVLRSPPPYARVLDDRLGEPYTRMYAGARWVYARALDELFPHFQRHPFRSASSYNAITFSLRVSWMCFHSENIGLKSERLMSPLFMRLTTLSIFLFILSLSLCTSSISFRTGVHLFTCSFEDLWYPRCAHPTMSDRMPSVSSLNGVPSEYPHPS